MLHGQVRLLQQFMNRQLISNIDDASVVYTFKAYGEGALRVLFQKLVKMVGFFSRILNSFYVKMVKPKDRFLKSY